MTINAASSGGVFVCVSRYKPDSAGRKSCRKLIAASEAKVAACGLRGSTSQPRGAHVGADPALAARTAVNACSWWRNSRMGLYDVLSIVHCELLGVRISACRTARADQHAGWCGRGPVSDDRLLSNSEDEIPPFTQISRLSLKSEAGIQVEKVKTHYPDSASVERYPCPKCSSSRISDGIRQVHDFVGSLASRVPSRS